ncbi:hypothetical protein BD779DRAFT_1565998 [Infundibulicybe gibba]|nr:hypothetical protein BD779DRAFT_1565998 [Infundibulicybe gibba]
MAPALSLQLARVTTSPHLPDAPGCFTHHRGTRGPSKPPAQPLPPFHQSTYHATPRQLPLPLRVCSRPLLHYWGHTEGLPIHHLTRPRIRIHPRLPIYTLASLLASIRMLWPKCTANNLDYFCTLRESHRRKLVILRYMIAFLGGNPRLKMGIS